MKAIGKRIILRIVTEETRSAGGLILDTKSTVQDRGVVTSVGRDVEGIQVGDTVILSHQPTALGDDLFAIHTDYVVACL